MYRHVFCFSVPMPKGDGNDPIHQQLEEGPGQMEDNERNEAPLAHDQNEYFAGRESAGTKRQTLQERSGQGEAINDLLLAVMRVSGPLWPVFAGIYLLYRVSRYIRLKLAQTQSANKSSAAREERLLYINRLSYGLLIVWIVMSFGSGILFSLSTVGTYCLVQTWQP